MATLTTRPLLCQRMWMRRRAVAIERWPSEEGFRMSRRLIALLVLGVPLLGGTSRAQTRPPIAEQIAKTYGLDSFGKVEAIRYTFNLELPGKNISRSWVWE